MFRILACCQKCQAILLSYCWIIFHWYINHLIFIHSSVDGHLGCFCILNIVNKAAISVGVYIFLKNTVFNSFGYVLNSGVTGLYGRPAFNFLRNRHIVFHTIEPIYIPINTVWGFLFFFFFFCGILTRTCCPLSLDNDHFDRCEVIIFHCSFDLHFPAAAAKSLQSCPTLCNPIDGSPPGSPDPGILQARILEWVAISFSTAFPCWYDIVRLFTSLLSIFDVLFASQFTSWSSTRL